MSVTSNYEQNDALDQIKRNRSKIVDYCYGNNRNNLNQNFTTEGKVQLQNFDNPSLFR